jgi:hypothetical protein
MTQQRMIRTADFELVIPDGWDILESECEENLLVVQSEASRARLTLSTRYYKSSLSAKELHDAFAGFVKTRRSAETETSPQMDLSEAEIVKGDGFWYSKWAGRDENENHRTCTLVTLENRKLYALFVEAFGMTDEELIQLAGQTFDNFETK